MYVRMYVSGLVTNRRIRSTITTGYLRKKNPSFFLLLFAVVGVNYMRVMFKSPCIKNRSKRVKTLINRTKEQPERTMAYFEITLSDFSTSLLSCGFVACLFSGN